MRLFDVLPTRVSQRMLLSARAIDRSVRTSDENIAEEVRIIRDPQTSIVEMVTGGVSVHAQRALKWPVALIAGAEELFRKR